MSVKLQLILALVVCICGSLSAKPPFTFDEFFNYTTFSSVTLSPDNGQLVLIQAKYRIWDRNVSEQHLYLYSLETKTRTLITTQATSFTPRWKGDLIALILSDSSMNQNKQKNLSDDTQYIHLYSIRTGKMYPIPIGKENIHTYTWSTTSMSIYFATRLHWSDEAEQEYKNEWKDVIEYEQQYRGDTIYRLDIENMTLSNIESLVNISFRVSEMACSPDGKQLVYATEPKSLVMQDMSDYELYSLDLTKHSPLSPRRLTNNTAIEANLKWSSDGSLFFTVIHSGSLEGPYEDSQGKLYNFNLTSNQIVRWANQFHGQVNEYDLLQNGRDGVIFFGVLSTEIQVYTQSSVTADLIKQPGLNGTYESLATSFGDNHSTIVFIYSSYQSPQEVYFVQNMSQLANAQVITSENKLFTERNLPQGKSYRWINEEDRTEIEGVLLYPPDKFEQKNLPLFVLIHGGPYRADGNNFRADWYKCGTMMATAGWLVLEPNYRGSIGYGDKFMQAVRIATLSGPGRDILSGVNALIQDGIADPKKLTIGGYSYGGYLTNWLITQTTQFNAAVSGAGSVENVADWGLTDEPITSIYFFGGYPWQVPSLYQKEAAIFQMEKARTPTHIVVPGGDNRVSSGESFILERALSSLNVPVKLIILPGESHDIGNNPWHEKIKIREELKWLQKYGNMTVS